MDEEEGVELAQKAGAAGELLDQPAIEGAREVTAD
jgi:hypothetical protein